MSRYDTIIHMSEEKKKKIPWVKIILIVLAIMFVVWLFSDEEPIDYSSLGLSNLDAAGEYQGRGIYGQTGETAGVRDFLVTSEGDNQDKHTIMIYFLGSDLESEAGFASGDIEEILAAELSDQVEVILMTGGALSWENEQISSETSQYWQVKNGELVAINDDLGQLNMTATETLRDFVQMGAREFPADRYSLIMWDHGGGTISGFGVDEHYPDATMTLVGLEDAIEQSGVKFDWIGFDACLMATMEVALALEPYADYLIASQELEPGGGWYYTNWLNNLSKTPGVSTVDLGAMIIDDYVIVSEEEQYSPMATLSMVELRQMPAVMEEMSELMSEGLVAIERNNGFQQLSRARSNAKDFGEGEYEQIDVMDYAIRAGGGEEVIGALQRAVSYYYNSSDIDGAYGLAMYFPYEYPDYYSEVETVLHEVGIETDYTDFFDGFMSAMAGGQSRGVGGGDNYQEQEWYDAGVAANYADVAEGEFLGELIIEERGEDYVLSLSEEEWEEIRDIELQVLLDDGEGYIDLGSDHMYAFNEAGELIVEFDYTWVALDGEIVPFYAEEEHYGEDGSWYSYGYVPAYLNESEYVEIMVRWDNVEPEAYVEGYRKYSETGVPAGKGLFDLKQGDQLTWIFDYYSYDWEYVDFFVDEESLIVGREAPKVSYEYVGDLDAVAYFVLRDYYNNVFETEAVVYY